MRVTLVIFSLSSGGAERVMSIMANYWVERGEDVTLITMSSSVNDFFTLDVRVRRISLNLKGYSTSIWSSFKNNIIKLVRLRAAIKKSHPDVVISFMDRMNVVTLIATRGLSVPVVVSEHIDPRQVPPVGVWKLLRRWTYLWAMAVVVLTEELRGVLSQFVTEQKLYVIPNPALKNTDKTDIATPCKFPSPFIAAMGRLVPQKGFDLLIKSFADCTNESWSLVILGDGPERDNLLFLAKKYGLDSRVYLPGNIENRALY